MKKNNAIRKWMDSKKLTIWVVAIESKYAPNTVAGWSCGEHFPSTRTLAELKKIWPDFPEKPTKEKK